MTDKPMTTTEATHALMASMAFLFLDVLDKIDEGADMHPEFTGWCRALVANTMAFTDTWRPE